MTLSFFDDPNMLAPPAILREDRPDGSFVLRSPQVLAPHARCIGEWLEKWAAATPDAQFLAERGADDRWRRLSYGEARSLVGSIGQTLIDMRLPPGKPVVILSDNAIDHALLTLAAMHVGRPVSSVSSAYSRLATDKSRVVQILKVLDPALVYASDAKVYGSSINAAALDAPVVFSSGADSFPGALAFDSMIRTAETKEVVAAFEALRPDDVAKYLLTSGSTGTPKVVINTHRMLCANQQAISQVWPFLDREKPIVLDWLPWSHTFGANHNFNLVLSHGGELWIDEGRPAPGLIEKSVRNLREVRPTLYFNVPRGFDVMADVLEADKPFAREFFGRLRGMFYAAAALPQSTWERIEAVAKGVRGEPVWFTSAWGATETAPLLTSVHWRIERAGCIGLPVPGVELKFVPNQQKLEMRVRGPSVFPGYRDMPEQTAAAFDEEGFYRIGDAGRLVDPERPERGVIFDGRVAEDFKLTTGTWVSVGTLRVRVVAALAPWAQDVVVTGHDRSEIGLLVFPGPQAKAMTRATLVEHVQKVLRDFRNAPEGSSQCPTRALLLDEPLSLDAGEVTDKGYVNQRAVLARRAEFVQTLHAASVSDDVILCR